MNAERELAALHARLLEPPALTVAVSGGVDSMTLAVVAHRLRPGRVAVFHAVSAAVPAEATRRVRALSAHEGWDLHAIDAGELAQSSYVANPVNRCFHCKRSLYATIAVHTAAQIVSGANVDDLGDYRPGLDAARDAGVRHPYIEAGIDKAGVRALARWLGLADLAELPSSPCLSSRVETGIAIAAPLLHGVDRVERYLRETLGAEVVRCRVRAGGLVIELDEAALGALSDEDRAALARSVRALFAHENGRRPSDFAIPVFAPYRRGSAFVGSRS